MDILARDSNGLLDVRTNGGYNLPSTSIYITATGNDSTGTGTSANPFLTFAGALSYYNTNYPNCVFRAITFNVGAGTFDFSSNFSTTLSAKYIRIVGAGVGQTFLKFESNQTIASSVCDFYRFDTVTFLTDGGYQLVFDGAVTANMYSVGYKSNNTGNSSFIACQGSAYVTINNDLALSIAGNWTACFLTRYGGKIRVNPASIDFTGCVPSSSSSNNALLNASSGGVVTVSQQTAFNNLPSDTRYNIISTTGGIVTGSSNATMDAYLAIAGNIIVDDWSTIFRVPKVNSSYSTAQTDSGERWTDGSIIYKKTINFGALPNATTKNVAHGITTPKIIRWEGVSRNAANTSTMVLPHAGTLTAGQSNIDVQFTNTNIQVTATQNMSTYTQTYITLYYTL